VQVTIVAAHVHGDVTDPAQVVAKDMLAPDCSRLRHRFTRDTRGVVERGDRGRRRRSDVLRLRRHGAPGRALPGAVWWPCPGAL